MSYAVIRTGGKQYRVREGDRLRVEKLEGDQGQELELDDVLMLNRDGEIVLDRDTLQDVKVKAHITRHGRGRKIRIYKFKRRKGYSRRMGHRQAFTEIHIDSIT